MKKHAIIPIFIPHRGCKNDCVFCNQRVITAREADITPLGAREVIEQYLSTLSGRGLDTIEISFFGGSFTGIPIEEQSAFLEVAKEYKDRGLVDKIHLSTRPDYIDKTILDNLKKYSVDVIELGVQSFSPKVLLASRRGHDVDCVYRACELIKEYGFSLGIQLMIGLPGDSYEACIDSVEKAISIGPDLARLYPTVVISDTKLYEMYKAGEYVPFSQDEMIRTVKDMYRKLSLAGINVMRVGLKSTALMSTESDFVACGYHPAFRQLVEGAIARDILEEKLAGYASPFDERELIITVLEGEMSNVVGHKGCNREYFREKYPNLHLKFVETEGKDDTSDYGISIQDVTEKKVYVSEDIHSDVLNYIEDTGRTVVKVSSLANVDERVSKHADIYMCSLEDRMYFGDYSKLSNEYPGDVLYNAARVGKYFICSKYTDEKLILTAQGLGLEIVKVKQGYVKCNLVIVDDTHVITEDEGIAKELYGTDINCLLVSPGYVTLPGYDRGFIGGASGRIGEEIVFHGDITRHPDCIKIQAFVKACGLLIKGFDFPLVDIGSIIEG